MEIHPIRVTIVIIYVKQIEEGRVTKVMRDVCFIVCFNWSNLCIVTETDNSARSSYCLDPGEWKIKQRPPPRHHHHPHIGDVAIKIYLTNVTQRREMITRTNVFLILCLHRMDG